MVLLTSLGLTPTNKPGSTEGINHIKRGLSNNKERERY